MKFVSRMKSEAEKGGVSCWPEGPGLAHTAKKDTQTKAGARKAAKSSTWQGPRLLQEARSSLEAAPHGASDARYHRALCGWTLSQKLSFSHTREVSCQLFPFRHRPASRGGILATVPSSFRQGFLMAASDRLSTSARGTSGSHGESHSWRRGNSGDHPAGPPTWTAGILAVPYSRHWRPVPSTGFSFRNLRGSPTTDLQCA